MLSLIIHRSLRETMKTRIGVALRMKTECKLLAWVAVNNLSMQFRWTALKGVDSKRLKSRCLFTGFLHDPMTYNSEVKGKVYRDPSRLHRSE